MFGGGLSECVYVGHRITTHYKHKNKYVRHTKMHLARLSVFQPALLSQVFSQLASREIFLPQTLRRYLHLIGWGKLFV